MGPLMMMVLQITASAFYTCNCLHISTCYGGGGKQADNKINRAS